MPRVPWPSAGRQQRGMRFDAPPPGMARVRRAGYANSTATFRRKTDAVEWVRGQELKILGGRTSVRGAARLPTLQDAIDKYLDTHKIARVDGTFDYLVNMTFKQLTRANLDRLEAKLTELKKTQSQVGKKSGSDLWLEDLAELGKLVNLS